MTGTWYGNGIRLAGKKEASLYSQNLFDRWMTPETFRVVESDDPPNYVYEAGALKLLKAAE